VPSSLCASSIYPGSEPFAFARMVSSGMCAGFPGY